jgi:hypothetical protein
MSYADVGLIIATPENIYTHLNTLPQAVT